MTDLPIGGDALNDWIDILGQCFIERHRAESVAGALLELQGRSPLDGQTISRLVLQSGAQNSSVIDPLIPCYFLGLLRSRIIDSNHILTALLSCSQFKNKHTSDNAAENQPPVSFAAQESVLSLLGNIYALEERPHSQIESLRCFRALSSWLKACNAFESIVQMDSGGMEVHSPGLLSVYEALGTLAAVMLNSSRVKKHLQKPLPKGKGTHSCIDPNANTMQPKRVTL